jgi:hypothetical protein
MLLGVQPASSAPSISAHGHLFPLASPSSPTCLNPVLVGIQLTRTHQGSSYSGPSGSLPKIRSSTFSRLSLSSSFDHSSHWPVLGSSRDMYTLVWLAPWFINSRVLVGRIMSLIRSPPGAHLVRARITVTAARKMAVISATFRDNVKHTIAFLRVTGYIPT